MHLGGDHAPAHPILVEDKRSGLVPASVFFRLVP